jgi:agmatinase
MKIEYALANQEEAGILIFGIPFDRTSSFIPGSRFGPKFIRQCTENIEWYSPFQDRSLVDLKICDLEDLEFASGDWLAEIEEAVDKILGLEKFPVFLGGEHTITYPISKAFKKVYKKFSIIHFDAHADLRDEFMGQKVCHATAIRRAADVVGLDNIYQFGIRSGNSDEFRLNKNLYRFKVLEPLGSVLDRIKDPIYLTIDLDVLDPGVMPAVSTPEPGGVSYQELINALLLLRGRHIIGADIVEYNPLAASPYASGTTAADVLRELLLAMSVKK